MALCCSWHPPEHIVSSWWVRRPCACGAVLALHSSFWNRFCRPSGVPTGEDGPLVLVECIGKGEEDRRRPWVPPKHIVFLRVGAPHVSVL